MPSEELLRKRWPLTSPTSTQRTWPATTVRTAPSRPLGTPRSLAKWLRVPRGKMPRGLSPPTRALTAQLSVPSPPPITTASASQEAARSAAAPAERNASAIRAMSPAVPPDSTEPAATFSSTLAFIALGSGEVEGTAEETPAGASPPMHPPDGAAKLDRAATLDDADQHHHDGDDQQEVDEPADRVAAHHSEQPQDEQDHEDRPEHERSFLGSRTRPDSPGIGRRAGRSKRRAMRRGTAGWAGASEIERPRAPPMPAVHPDGRPLYKLRFGVKPTKAPAPHPGGTDAS